jgi:hypothetical protein
MCGLQQFDSSHILDHATASEIERAPRRSMVDGGPTAKRGGSG